MCCTILNGSKILPTLSSSSAAAVVVSCEKTLNLGLVLPAHNKSTSSQELGLCLKRRKALRSGRRKNWVHHFHGPASGGLLTKRFLSKLNDSLPSANCTDLSMEEGETVLDSDVANDLRFVHKVSLDVAAPPDLVWHLWMDLKRAPQWMRWIDRVEILAEDGSIESEELQLGLSQLSRWICSTAGFEVMWLARIEFVEAAPPLRVVRWATVEGLQSKGEVTFKESSSKGTTVELSILHSLPAALGQVMNSQALRSLVQATLQSDLERFQKYVAEAADEQSICYGGKEEGLQDRKTLPESVTIAVERR